MFTGKRARQRHRTALRWRRLGFEQFEARRLLAGAPQGADKLIVIPEDQETWLTAGDFGFSDPLDTPADTFVAVKIATRPALGVLTLEGVPVVAGQSVAATDIAAGRLRYQPAPNGNGLTYASFTFQVQDNGGTAAGGVDLDPVANTIQFRVTEVNDAPVGADSYVPHFYYMPVTLRVSDFRFDDSADQPVSSLKGVKIASLPSLGSLMFEALPVVAGQVIAAGDLAAGKLRYVPPTNFLGVSSFTFQVQDYGGTASGGVDLDPVARKLVLEPDIGCSCPVNSYPTVSVHEDSAYTLTVDDLRPDPWRGAPKSAVFFPASYGVLIYEGQPSLFFQEISWSGIEAGKLTYLPPANFNGQIAIRYRLNYETSQDFFDRTLGIYVQPVNDAPQSIHPTIDVPSNAVRVLLPADFPFFEFEGDRLRAVSVETLPAHGALWLDGKAVAAGQRIAAADLVAGKLTYTPTTRYDPGATETQFAFRLQDDGGTANGGQEIGGWRYTLTIRVTAVNDAPGFVRGADVQTDDMAGEVVVGGWATQMHAGLAAPLLGSVATAQNLTFQVTQISQPGLFAKPPEIAADGSLRFMPRPNAHGAAQITVVLRDDGGTANGGQDTSPPQSFAISIVKPLPWRNSVLPLDVTGDGVVTARDALRIINFVNAYGSGPVSPGGANVSGYVDADGNNQVSGSDVLAVVNFLNTRGGAVEEVAEGEAAGDSAGADWLGLLAVDLAAQGKRKR